MKKFVLIIAAAIVLGAAPRAEAIVILLDTTPLQSLGGDWFLDFQLVDGDGAAGNNTVTISGIDLGVGGGFVSETLSAGVAGAFPNVTLTDSAGPTQALVKFTAGDKVQFDLTYTNNCAGGCVFADTFSWAVLDGSLPPPNSIVDGGLGAGLVILLTGGKSIELYPADAAYSFIEPEIVGVPEPMVAALFLSGLAVAGIRRRRG